MKKNFDLSSSLWLKVPILFYILGFLVHNLYMAKYNLSEFDLWQSKYILSGVLFLALIFIFGTLKSNIKNPFRYLKRNYPSVISRIIIFSFVIASGISHNLIHGDLRNFLSDTISDKINFNIVFFSYFMMSMVLIDLFGNISEWDLKFGKHLNTILKWLSFPLIALFVMIAYFNSITLYVFVFFIIVLSYYYAALYSKLDAARYIYAAPLADGVEEETQRKYSFLMSTVFLILGLISITYIYSRTIYPNFPISIGGAKPYEATIIVERDTLNVKIIGESKDWIIFKSSDSSDVVRIKNQLVDKIVIAND